MKKISESKGVFRLLCVLLVLVLAGGAAFGMLREKENRETETAQTAMLRNFAGHLQQVSALGEEGLQGENWYRAAEELSALCAESRYLLRAGMISQEDADCYHDFFLLYLYLIDTDEPEAVAQDLALFERAAQMPEYYEGCLSFDEFVKIFQKEHRADYQTAKELVTGDSLAVWFPEEWS